MFETLPNPSLDVVLIALRGLLLLGALCVFAMAFIRWRRADEHGKAQMQQQLDRAFTELRSLHETVAVMSARVEALCERVEAGARFAPIGAVPAQRGYDMAVRLARNGAQADELVAHCGMTRHEAQLLVRLHGAQSGEGDSALGRLERPAPTASRTQPSWPDAMSSKQAPQPRAGGRKRGSLLSVVG